MDVDISVDDVYILDGTGVIFQYNSAGELVDSHKLLDQLDVDETYSKIRFSKTNTDILYVLTTKNIYKKFKTLFIDWISSTH